MFKRLNKNWALLLAVGLVVISNSAKAEVILPTTCDTTEYITAGFAVLAGIIAAAIGGKTAVLLVKKAIAWIGRAFG
jgi:hypothetical protein